MGTLASLLEEAIKGTRVEASLEREQLRAKEWARQQALKKSRREKQKREINESAKELRRIQNGARWYCVRGGFDSPPSAQLLDKPPTPYAKGFMTASEALRHER